MGKGKGKPVSNTGDEVQCLKLLYKLRYHIDTIGGPGKAEDLRHALDKRATEMYRLLTGVDDPEDASK